jgi:hypothetical protein
MTLYDFLFHLSFVIPYEPTPVPYPTVPVNYLLAVELNGFIFFISFYLFKSLLFNKQLSSVFKYFKFLLFFKSPKIFNLF